jgi:putative acyl-CoA dehydrogenase
MCDLFLVLAQAPGGLSCFLVPRVLPDGSRNTFRIQRLKDKLGNRSNASSEPEFDGTVAWQVGEEGRGVRTIIEMVSMTRLDCVIGSAALMRQTLVQAIHHAQHRSAFGGLLVEKPAMQNVLADLALESEAATTLMLRLAGAVDREETAFKRLAVAVGKYWVTKRCPVFAGEALECLGGNGYVEDSGMPRLYREAPLNSVWEGSGNVNALDVLRAMAREPESVEAFFAEVERADDARITAAVSDLAKDLGEADEVSARRLVERLAMTLQASLLVRYAPDVVADAYIASRLQGDWGSAFGTLGRTTAFTDIIERAAPR